MDFAEKLAYHDISAKSATFSVISQYKSLLMYRSKRLKCYLKYGSMVGSELHYLVSVFCLQIFCIVLITFNYVECEHSVIVYC